MPDILKLCSSVRIAARRGGGCFTHWLWGGVSARWEPIWVAGTEAAGLVLREVKMAVEIPGRGRAGEIRT